jgi:hypothetical protein
VGLAHRHGARDARHDLAMGQVAAGVIGLALWFNADALGGLISG